MHKLESCLLELSTKILGDAFMDRDNRNYVMNKISDITIEVFHSAFLEEIKLLQQELRNEKLLTDTLRKEHNDTQARLYEQFDYQQRELQQIQLREIKELQDMVEQQEITLQKQTIQGEKLSKTIKDLQQRESQLQTEILKYKEASHQGELDSKLKNQDLFEQKQKADQYQQLFNTLEKQFKENKQELDKLNKDYQDQRKKTQHQIDINIALETELQQKDSELQRLSDKKNNDSHKYKDALEQLKTKSNNKIQELKEKLKEASYNQQIQQDQLDEFKELVKEQEQQLNNLQNTHKAVTKQMESQYKKQVESIEKNFLEEQKTIEHQLGRSFEQIISDKDRQILDQQKELKVLKEKIPLAQIDLEKLQRQNILLEQSAIKQQDEIKNLINELEFGQEKYQKLELENTRKEQKLKLLLNDLEEIKQFSEQTLQTIKENQDYISELEREKDQQSKIIQNIQDELEIEIKGSFSYQRLGQELEQRCKLYKDQHQQILSECIKKEAIFAQEAEHKNGLIQQLKNQLDDELKQHQDQIEHLQGELKKQRLETKIKCEDYSRQILQLQKEQITGQNQQEQLKKQNESLIQELQVNVQQLQIAKEQLQELIIKEKLQQDEIQKKLSQLQTEKHNLIIQLDEAQFKTKALSQRIKRYILRYRDQLEIQINDIKQFVQNRLKVLEGECKVFLQTGLKKVYHLMEAKVQAAESDRSQERDEMAREMDKRLDLLKKQFRQSEQLIQEESAMKLKQKQQQIDQLVLQKTNDRQLDDLRQQIQTYIRENEHLIQQLNLNDKLSKEEKAALEHDIQNLNNIIKEQQDEILSQQQFADYTMNKERQYYEKKIQELKAQSERKVEQLQSDYNSQITQLEQIVSPQRFSPKHSHKLSATGKSPYQSALSSTKSVQQRFNSPSQSMRTPHRSPNLHTDQTDKTIEELRQEIQMQKQKLSRMKLNFTESQKKSSSKY
ncbi:hypothetical protein pb186bvf_020631 [Paramecium bursaria]